MRSPRPTRRSRSRSPRGGQRYYSSSSGGGGGSARHSDIYSYTTHGGGRSPPPSPGRGRARQSYSDDSRRRYSSRSRHDDRDRYRDDAAAEGVTIFVSNLPDAPAHRVRFLLEQLAGPTMAFQKDGSRAAWLTYENFECAETAYMVLRDHRVEGVHLDVEMAKAPRGRSPSPPRRGSKRPREDDYGPRDDESPTSGTTLFIGNLDYGVTSEDVLDLFDTYGQVIGVNLPTREGHQAGYGFVHFRHEDEAMNAQNSVDGRPFKGRKIRVQLSTSSRCRQAQGSATTTRSFKRNRRRDPSPYDREPPAEAPWKHQHLPTQAFGAPPVGGQPPLGPPHDSLDMGPPQTYLSHEPQRSTLLGPSNPPVSERHTLLGPASNIPARHLPAALTLPSRQHTAQSTRTSNRYGAVTDSLQHWGGRDVPRGLDGVPIFHATAHR